MWLYSEKEKNNGEFKIQNAEFIIENKLEISLYDEWQASGLSSTFSVWLVIAHDKIGLIFTTQATS